MCLRALQPVTVPETGGAQGETILPDLTAAKALGLLQTFSGEPGGGCSQERGHATALLESGRAVRATSLPS